MNSLTLAVKDLQRYSKSEIKTLASYYHVAASPISVAKAILSDRNINFAQMMSASELRALSDDQLRQVPQSDLPHGGNLAAARNARDAQAIMAISKWQRLNREIRPARTPTPPSEASEASTESESFGCRNPMDYITQDDWSNDYKPTFEITVLNDSGEPAYKSCYDKEQLKTWFNNPNNVFAVWIPNKFLYPLDNVGRTIAEGAGGAGPGSTLVAKLPDNIYVDYNSLKISAKQGIDELVAIPVGTNVRIGNLEGTYGVSQNHGQSPGFRVYFLGDYEEYDLAGINHSLDEVFDEYLAKRVGLPCGQKDYSNFTPAEKIAYIQAMVEKCPYTRKDYDFNKVPRSGVPSIVFEDHIPEVDMVINNNSTIVNLVENGASSELLVRVLRQAPASIRYLTNPSEELQLAAVRTNGTSIFEVIESLNGVLPSDEVQLAAVNNNAEAIEYIQEYGTPSEELQLAAVRNNPGIIDDINNATDAVNREAARLLRAEYAVSDEDSAEHADDWDESPELFSEEDDVDDEQYYIDLVANNPHALLELDYPSEAVIRAAFQSDDTIIREIEDPSEEMQLIAIDVNPDMIYSIRNPTVATQVAALLSEIGIEYLQDLDITFSRDAIEEAVRQRPELQRHVRQSADTFSFSLPQHPHIRFN